MGKKTKLQQWKERTGHSFGSLAKALDLSPQSVHAGFERGTFGRLTIHKLVALSGGELRYEDFLLPEERKVLEGFARERGIA